VSKRGVERCGVIGPQLLPIGRMRQPVPRWARGRSLKGTLGLTGRLYGKRHFEVGSALSAPRGVETILWLGEGVS